MTDRQPPEFEPIFEEDPYLEPEKAKLTLKGAAIVGARVVTGLVGIGVAVVTIAAATFVPWPGIRSTPPRIVVTPVATGQQLVCAGSVLRLADAQGQDATTASPLGRASVRYDASPGSVDAEPVSQSDASNGGQQSAPFVLTTPPNVDDPTMPILVAGAQSEEIDEEEFSGLAAADCSVATGDVWLVGGSAVVGRTTLITLSNPTEVAATVDLEIFGENGLVSAPGTRGIIVAPDGQRILSLAGFAPDLESPVVHVLSRGGLVVANLQQTTTRGLDPGGVDIVAATTAPAIEQVIPGVVITGLAAQQQLQVSEGYDDLIATLRLFVPGETAAKATVHIVPEDGSTTGASYTVDVDADRVSDLALTDLAEGAYTVTVTADQPFVAGVRISAATSERNDFAWLGASTQLRAETLFVVAPGPGPVLHLGNSGTSDTTVMLAGQDGAADVAIDVKAGASVSVPLEPGASYLASGFESLYAALSFVDPGRIAHYGVRPPGVGSTPITVYP